MKGKTHMLAAETFSLAYIVSTNQIHNLNIQELIPAGILMGSSIIGSLLPDIDKKHTKISSKYKFTSFILRIFTTHRGITHSPICLLMLSLGLLALYYIFPSIILYNIVIGIILGYLSHLILDMLNPTGIPLLFPLSKTKFSVLSIRTGGLIENIFNIALIFINMYIIGNLN